MEVGELVARGVDDEAGGLRGVDEGEAVDGAAEGGVEDVLEVGLAGAGEGDEARFRRRRWLKARPPAGTWPEPGTNSMTLLGSAWWSPGPPRMMPGEVKPMPLSV